MKHQISFAVDQNNESTIYIDKELILPHCEPPLLISADETYCACKYTQPKDRDSRYEIIVFNMTKRTFKIIPRYFDSLDKIEHNEICFTQIQERILDDTHVKKIPVQECYSITGGLGITGTY